MSASPRLGLRASAHLLLLVLLPLAGGSTNGAAETVPGPEVETIELAGARVWTGTGFVERSLFVSGGTFVSRPAGPADRVIHLLHDIYCGDPGNDQGCR